MTASVRPLSLSGMLDPEVLADPYPFYARLRQESPVLWDPFLHAWVITRYEDVAQVLAKFRAERTPTPGRLSELGMERLAPVAQIMVKQMLFMDPPEQRRVRGLASTAFKARRVEQLRDHITDIANDLIDRVLAHGEMDLIHDFANPLPAIVTAEMLGVPTEDHTQLKDWTLTFAELIGNFQLNPDGIDGALDAVSKLTGYLRDELVRVRRGTTPPVGLIGLMSHAQIDGDRLTEEELIANVIVTMVGGHETTTNLIGNGLLTLMGRPDALRRMRDEPAILPVAIEELLRYESPVQTTARISPADMVLSGQEIERGDAVIAVIAAANRDPDRFVDPDRLDLTRKDNRHLAFGWGSHFCFGAPLARLEAEIAFHTLLTRLPELELAEGGLRREWRSNLGLRGLGALPLRWRA